MQILEVHPKPCTVVNFYARNFSQRTSDLYLYTDLIDWEKYVKA